MELWNSILIGIAFVAAIAVLIDVYLLLRRRWLLNEVFSRQETGAPNVSDAPVAGIDAKGELTTGAKYAIWSYMFRILAVGGTIIGIVSGIAGYMIKDLATKTAMGRAFEQMQVPLNAQLKLFADANASLVAAEKMKDDKVFKGAVADELIGKGELQRQIVQSLSNGDGFRKSVADLLAAQHADQLRGAAGKDGVSPSSDEVAGVLVGKYADQLRGAAGKDGVSPSADEVAKLLASQLQVRPRPEPRRPR